MAAPQDAKDAVEVLEEQERELFKTISEETHETIEVTIPP